METTCIASCVSFISYLEAHVVGVVLLIRHFSFMLLMKQLSLATITDSDYRT